MICGIDEAGRGTLAGSLFMAGVILEKPIEGLRDSKKISPKKREIFYKEIIENSKYHIYSANSEIVDKFGLTKVIQIGLKEIMSNLKSEKYIFDGNSSYKIPNLEFLIGGDDIISEISAASILAKVSKDREMFAFDKIYPKWNFAKHKGYGTKIHNEKIREFGVSPIHRKSFKIKSLNQPSLF